MTVSQINNEKKSAEDVQDADNVFGAINSVADQLAAIEKFFARRFDEISMEINATSQQVDLAEEGITNRFSEILEVLHAISFSGDGNTPANAGVELDAVVDMTEEAANRILDAAGRINTLVKSEKDWENKDLRKNAINEIDQEVEEIFLACSFQDITGQRIRKTLENLKLIEDRLGTALNKMGIEITLEGTPPPATATSQDDIDALFQQKNAEKN